MKSRFSPLSEKPTIPDYLSEDQSNIFNSIVDELYQNKQLYQTDIPIIELFAIYSAKCKELAQNIQSLTTEHTNSKSKTNVILSPEFRALRDSTELLLKIKKQIENRPEVVTYNRTPSKLSKLTR